MKDKANEGFNPPRTIHGRNTRDVDPDGSPACHRDLLLMEFEDVLADELPADRIPPRREVPSQTDEAMDCAPNPDSSRLARKPSKKTSK